MQKKYTSIISFILFILFSSLFIVGCNSTTTEKPSLHLKESQKDSQTDLSENEEDNEEAAESEQTNKEDVEMKDGLEVINESPIGDYQASGVTNFLVTKEYKPEKFMPDIYLEKDHPYIQEVEELLTALFTALYEVDYQTITNVRHEPYFIGELHPDSPYLDTTREVNTEVITEFKETELRTINFEKGMEKARVGSDVIYYVKHSTETKHPYDNKYLPGKHMIVSVTTDIERIDGTWKVTNATELVPEVLEE